jgi:cyanate permease
LATTKAPPQAATPLTGPLPPPAATTFSGAPISPYRWAMVVLFVAGTWSFTFTSLSFGLLLPDITQSLGLSTLQQGWLGSSLRMGNVVMALPAAVLLTRLDPIKLSLAAIGLSAGFIFLHGLAPVFAVFFIARLGFGIAFSMNSPARAMLNQQWFPLKELPMVSGITIGLSGVAEALTLALTPFIRDASGSWRATYFAYGAVSLLVLAAWLLFARQQRAPDQAPSGASGQLVTQAERGAVSLRAVMRRKELWLLGLGTMGTTLGWWAFAVFWPKFMLDEHGFSLKQSGLLFSLISIGTIPSSLFFGFFASRVRRRRPLLVGSGLLLTGASLGMLLSEQMAVLVPMGLLAGIAWGHLPIALTMPYELPGLRPREVPVGLSMVTTLMMTGGVLGPITVGAIESATGSAMTALVVGALFPLVLCVCSLFLPDRPALR